MISGVRVRFFSQVPSSQGQEYGCLQHPVQNLARGECSEGLCEDEGPEGCGDRGGELAHLTRATPEPMHTLSLEKLQQQQAFNTV